MSSQSETVIRFAGHDLTVSSNWENINVINRAIQEIEKQPQYMTDVFNMSSASDEFYRFEANGTVIQGERHFLLAICNQLQRPKTLVNLSQELHDIMSQITIALNLNFAAHNPHFAAQHRISAKTNAHCKIYKFQEHALVIQGERHHIMELAKALRSIEQSGDELSTTVSDLVYQIEYAFDIDGVRSEDSEIPFNPNFADQYLI